MVLCNKISMYSVFSQSMYHTLKIVHHPLPSCLSSATDTLLQAVLVLSHFSHVQLFATCGPYPTSFLFPWDSPGNNTGVCCHFLLQGIFPAHGSNPSLLHCKQILYHLDRALEKSRVFLQTKRCDLHEKVK